ncbi:MAG: reactive intermediate/imine deaminase [Candidatus Marinimicrobia bacterium]|nr:reactive intermediate/imine deaminase [Candidatus Neomarinimicrobiota bacterium]MBV67092.1 reactive intermediate/imine deaminase [Candidatus Neomarinimicrobiota bacterium]
MNRVKTKNAPKAIGAYSQGSIFENLVFTSGQIAINPISGNLVTDDFSKEVEQVLENINSVLEAGGSNRDNIIKLTVFLTDMSNFKFVNEAFENFFIYDYPARSVVEVSGLPLNVNIEIEAIGIKI